MAGSVNKAIIIGMLGKDPEIRSFNNGGRVANFSVATSESWKDKTTGEKKERTEWHRVSVFNDSLVTLSERFLRKGMKVYIEGQIETRKYEKDGRDIYTTEIVLRPYRGEINILSSPSSSKNDAQEGEQQHKGFDKQGDVGAAQENAMSDDEIPF